MKAVTRGIPAGDEWISDLKWDGMRLQVNIFDNEPTLWSGSGRNVTSHFPELATITSAVGLNAVLDGEAVVFDGTRPSFHRLQNRIHVATPTAALVESHPVFFLAFDLLALDDQELFDVPLVDRRRLLRQVLDEGPAWRVPSYSEGDPKDLFELAKDRELEGIVCKRRTSKYRPGQRSPDWIKIKIRARQEFVIGGWLPGSGGLDGTVGSVLVGVYQGSDLVFAGGVGSGLRDDTRRRLLDELSSTEACPFVDIPVLDKTPQWVEPTMVAEVEYSLWAADGVLWHPTFCGLRIDKDPQDVVRETPAAPDPVDDVE